MIQRVQTLFLLGVIAIAVVLFFFPLASFLSDFYYFKLYLLQMKSMAPGNEEMFSEYFTLPLLALNVATGLVALIAILYFKKRMLQLRLVRFAFLLEIVFIALIFFYYIPQIEESLVATSDYTGVVGIYLPLGSLLLLILANRFIIRDEKLIRSADRLR
jgi:hypothetical protein